MHTPNPSSSEQDPSGANDAFASGPEPAADAQAEPEDGKKASLLEEVEEQAREHLGLHEWDRASVFEEAALSATEADAPYWAILMISGAIATLGVTLDNSAVVIGAMLIAPVLAPIMGLGLALSVGDGRLAVQTAVVVVASMAAVVVVAALLTVALPFRSITTEIAARTRPTTLDLAIAIFSGLAAAVVTVVRKNRLAAALPGVAISVALIPPLAVVGFGVGAGWRWPLIRGSLLLVGANLAGIVLSAVLVFFLVGMYRAEVRSVARRWHAGNAPSGLAAVVDRWSWVRRMGVIRSPLLRLVLVAIFVAAVAIPLSGAFTQLVRETRVQQAINVAAQAFENPGRSSVLEQQVVQQAGQTKVFLRVATSQWYGEEERERFEREAGEKADEPVELVLEQILASAGDLKQVADMLPSRGPSPSGQAAGLGRSAPALPLLTVPARERLRAVTETLALPEGTKVLAAQLILADREDVLELHYTAARPLPPEARQLVSREVGESLEAPDLRIQFQYIPAGPIALSGTPVDTAAVRGMAEAIARYDSLGAVLIAGAATDSARVAAASALLRSLGVAPLTVERVGEDSLHVRLRVP